MADSSPLAVDLRRRLESLGIERTAFDWLLKALHPASTHSSPGIPDEMSSSAMCPDFRDQCVVSMPTTVTSPTWDLCVWVPPGDNTIAIYCAANAGADFSESGGPAGATTAACCCQTFTYGPPDVSTTFTGTPGLTVGTIRVSSLPNAYRTQYSSITAYMTASALNDQGTVFAGQVSSPAVLSHSSTLAPGAQDPSGNQVGVRISGFMIPLDENDLLLMNPQTWTGPARDGVYVPLRLVGPTQPWVPLVEAATTVVGFGGDVYLTPGWANPPWVPTTPLSYCAGGSTAGYNWSTSVSGAGIPTSVAPVTGVPIDSGYDNVRHGVIIFRGLSPSASITLKFFRGLEQRPLIDAPSRTYVRPPLKPSPAAMHAYYAIANETAQVYPASFNSLGTIVAAVASAVSRLWPVVRPMLPALFAGAQQVVQAAKGRPQLSDRQVVVVERPRAATPARMVRSSSISSLRKAGKGKSRGKR